ncbi:hypothetical protein JCM11251_006078 [Rhodosporidiobolus azoricus]
MTIHEAWLVGPSSAAEVDSFLSSHKPSLNRKDLGPWIWVQIPRSKGKSSADGEKEKPAEELGSEDEGYAAFEKDAEKVMSALDAKLQHVKETAPVRGKKSAGIKSQKELREVEHEKLRTDLEGLAKKHKILSGKWLFFRTDDLVDAVWDKIVKAIALEDGPLAKTGVVSTAKVSAFVEEGAKDPNHVICVYVNDSFDKDAVKQAFKVLVEDLGLVSSAYKADAYTIAGIDSNRPGGGFRSSLYSKTTFMKQEEIDEALKSGSKAKEVKKKTAEEEAAAGANDGFDEASDKSSEEEEEEERPRKKAKSKK